MIKKHMPSAFEPAPETETEVSTTPRMRGALPRSNAARAAYAQSQRAAAVQRRAAASSSARAQDANSAGSNREIGEVAATDAAMRGDSAEGLLSRAPSGAGASGSVQRKKQKVPSPTPPDVVASTADEKKDEQPKALAGPKRSAEEAEHMERDIRKAENRYLWICMQQKIAVDELEKAKDAKDPPPLWKTALSAAVQVALAGGLGAIGKMVELGVTAKLATGAADDLKVSDAARVVAKTVASGAKSFAMQAATAVVNSSASGSKASKDAFWTSQKSVLIDTGKNQQDKFIDQQASIRAAPDGPAQARALRQSLDVAYAEAKPVQRMKSLDEWCNVIAASDLGGSPAEPNVRRHLGDSSLTGVLGINIKIKSAGSKPWITSAEIEGLNSQLRGEIASRALKDIRITKNIHADLPGDNFDFALYPNGDFDWQRVSAQAGAFLEKHAVARGKPKNSLEGARAMIEDDLADEKIPKLEG